MSAKVISKTLSNCQRTNLLLSGIRTCKSLRDTRRPL
jgi:hypothetical protein